MRRSLRWLVRIVVGSVVTLALIGAAAYLWIGSDAGRAWIRDAAAGALGEAFGARVEMATLERTQGLEVAADRLDVTIDGRPFITAERVVARPAFPSLWPPVLSLAIEVSDFEVRIGRGPDGRFDVERLDLGGSDSEEDPVDLDQIRFELARGRVRLEDVAAETLVFRDVGGAGEVVWETPSRSVLHVERVVGRTGELALGVHGDLDLDDDLRFRAEVTARGTPGEDLARIAGVAPDAELDAHASGSGTFAEPTARVEVASGDAKLAGTIGLAPGADGAAVLDGSWTIARVDPARLVPGALAGDLSGEGRVTLVPSRGLEGLQGDAQLQDSELAGVRMERFHATAQAAADRVAFEVDATAPAAAYGVAGTGSIGLASPYPTTFQADLSLEDASALPGELADVLAATRVRGRLEVDAPRPIEPARELTARLELEPGEVRGLALSRATARADLQGDLLQIGELDVVTAHTRLHGSGRMELTPAGPVEARVTGPIDLRLVPGIEATGVVDAEVDVSGRMDDLSARAHVVSTNRVTTPQLSARIDAQAELRGLGTGTAVATLRATGDGKPLGGLAESIGDESRALELAATWNERPGRVAKGAAAPKPAQSAGAAQATNAPPSVLAKGGLAGRVEASFSAREADGRDQRIALVADLGPERTAVELQSLEVAPRRGAAWRLTRPARLVLASDALEVEGMEIDSRDGAVTARGALRRGAGKNDLEVVVRGVDLALACQIAGIEQRCSGPIDLTLLARGTGAAPQFDGRLGVQDLRVDERKYGDLNATLHADRRLRVDVALGAESAPDLRAEASIGLTTGGLLPALDRRAPLEARARADALPLDGLIGFTGDALRDLDGRARVDVRVGGTLDQPRLDGSAAITGLLLAVTSTGATYRDGTATLLVTSDEVRLAQLDLADGSVRGGGVVKLAGGLPDVLDLWLELEDAPILARPQADASGSGRFVLEGTMEAPRLAGELVVSPATIRPTLAAGGAGPPPDPTITVIRGDEPEPPDAEDALGQLLAGQPSADDEEEAKPPPAERQLVDRLAIRVTVAIGKRVVVQRTDAHLRLTGQLEVTKVPGGEIQVVGAIESENGWYLFQGRRVEIERAALRFGGEWPVDPALDVSAEARSGGYEVDIEIHGTLSEPTLNLSSSPPLDQGDILSVLLFGRPASQLSGGQGELLQRQALSVLANYVAPDLQHSLMDTFGLAAVTFSMPTGDRAGTVGVGRYFGNDLFVSLAQDFGGPKGGTQRQLQGLIGTSVTIQYSLTPSITLQTASSTEGESSVDVIWHRRY